MLQHPAAADMGAQCYMQNAMGPWQTAVLVSLTGYRCASTALLGSRTRKMQQAA
jgi:hypothetical protein